MPSSEGVPRFEYNHKTVFIAVIDVHDHEGTASKRPIPDTVTISTEDVVRESAESQSTQEAELAKGLNSASV
jgi:hypothetical protein